MTVGLVMCVRDEEAVIGRCLASVRDHVDAWTIVDTGSADRTRELVLEALEEIPGQLLRGEWVNFGTNRTRALELARGTADYLLMMDADMTLRMGKPVAALAAGLTENAYDLTVEDGDVEYRLPVLIRGDLDWRLDDVTHECLVGDGFALGKPPLLAGWRLIHHADGHRRPVKFRDDLRLYLAEVERAGHATARQAFYLAQTYRHLGMVDEAVAWYRVRLSLGGWDEERFYASYQLGCLLSAHTGVLAGFPHLLEAYRMRPGRAEPMRALSAAAGAVAGKLEPPDDGLFVEPDKYGPRP